LDNPYSYGKINNDLFFHGGKMKFTILIALAASLLIFISCSKGKTSDSDSSGPTYKYYVYVTNYTDNTISAFTEDPTTGALTSTGSATSAGTKPTMVVAHPNGGFLYVNHGDESTGTNTIQAYSINKSTGALTAVGSAVASGYASFAIDPSGKFLYSVEYGSGGGSPAPTVFQYSINTATGALTAMTPASIDLTGVVGNNWGLLDVVVNPTSTYAYISNNWGNTIIAMSINASTGALTHAASLDLASASHNSGGASDVTNFAMDPAGKYIYGSNNQTPGGIDTYLLNQSTAAVTWGSFAAESESSNLNRAALDPAGKCLFVGGGAHAGVYAYSINSSSGALTELSGSPYMGPAGWPAVDPQGKFVYVVGPTTNISIYSLNSSTCGLTAASPATATVGAGPQSVAAVKIQQ
jgi:6-phosphogluconolactonase (cycloisomerase 2 family)